VNDRLIPPWHARLALDFAARDGRSVLTRREQYGPLAVQKPLYPEGDAVCHTVLLHPPGGIAGGDQIDIALTLDAGGHALITTPGAAKWYRSLGAVAQQQVRCHVAAGAALEYLPQESILFDGCHGSSVLEVQLDEGATFIGWDISVMGRPASGEDYLSGVFRQRSEILINGQSVLFESARLAGDDAFLRSSAGYRGYRVTGTLLAAGKKASADTLAACRALVLPLGALAGITQCPSVLIARYLGDDAEAARTYFAQVWSRLRPDLLGREAQPPRIWST
jgi:urease accessory protein